MANKRNLKKMLNYVCGELLAECVAAAACSTRPDANDNMNALFTSILRMHSDYIMRVSHPEPGIAAKQYYKILVDSFTNDANDVIDQIGNMLN